jgi:hypothetical protein
MNKKGDKLWIKKIGIRIINFLFGVWLFGM